MFVPLLAWEPYTKGGRKILFTPQRPIDIDPSPIGTVCLFTWPKPLPGGHGPSLTGVPVRNVGRQLSPEEAKFYRADRGALFRIHFDSCSARRGRYR